MNRMEHAVLDDEDLYALPQRIEIVDSTSAEYLGRVAVRRAALALAPTEPIDYSTAKALRPREAGPLWKIVPPDGVTIALRARDASDLGQVRPDIAKLVRRRDELHAVIVEDRDGGRVSFWVLRGRHVVIVGARILPERQRATIERDARRVMGVLAGMRMPATPRS